MNTLEDVLKDTRERMDKAVEYLQDELSGLRTGKASPSLVENITVDYYGTPTRLRDIANIATPEARLITISPFDPSSLQAIEKAITAANLGITPMNDGRIIRIPIPELTEERREELSKVAKRMTEEQRVAVRNVRREANDQIKQLQKNGDITEDDRDDALEETQKLTDRHIKSMDEMLEAKTTEMMEV
ncbi:ribosome recycling factor [Kiritimatiella glycovorans]|uniref:Ribosome-recycling factor n=1 Tax=Kiritimatiella glycovorans TaxID=1307763 RepID=A0A0G3EGS9_9BACT|nr:ribosome recycling factor [Kiritimatiella glycovorans]AKJ64015.1 Ribosome-recycling factor [Kiritimatiella glycovorans]